MTYYDCVDGKTSLIGLFASPVKHTLSPKMHNMSFRRLGLNYIYVPFDIPKDNLEYAIQSARTLNMRGFNVSMPNKVKIIPFLDEISTEAKFIGAVNTVVNDQGRLIGHNTDGIGYMKSLSDKGIIIKDRKMTLLGGGGAATSIAIQAALDGVAEISIFNRNDEFFLQALKIAEVINKDMKSVSCNVSVNKLENESLLKNEIADSDILTNATCLGMHPLEGQSLITSNSWLHENLIVSDIVYNPRQTRLLQQATKTGCFALNGLGMMLWQGAKAFEIWTDHQMPIDYVKEQMF